MSRWTTVTLAALLACGFVAGLLYLFGMQFAAGDVYPEYSSLRTGPDGSKLLFDALAHVPGIRVERNYLPLDSFNRTGAAILLLGFDAAAFAADSDTQVRAERLASRGNRVVITMRRMQEVKQPKTGSLYRNWDVKFGVDSGKRVSHRLFFAVARDWRVLDSAGPKLLAIERGFGKGSIVLAAEGADFSNAATVARDRLELVAAALGPSNRIVFDEQHFGISETGSIVGLARRYRLTGFALGLALCAAMVLWRQAAAFPPPAKAAPLDRLPGRTSQTGLVTLLRRHIAPRDLADACWREWSGTRRRALTDAEAMEARRQLKAVLEKRL
jgi:hypothetical protein